jgi:hypothetical protein
LLSRLSSIRTGDKFTQPCKHPLRLAGAVTSCLGCSRFEVDPHYPGLSRVTTIRYPPGADRATMPLRFAINISQRHYLRFLSNHRKKVVAAT